MSTFTMFNFYKQKRKKSSYSVWSILIFDVIYVTIFIRKKPPYDINFMIILLKENWYFSH